MYNETIHLVNNNTKVYCLEVMVMDENGGHFTCIPGRNVDCLICYLRDLNQQGVNLKNSLL